jgi:hypothetical protein
MITRILSLLLLSGCAPRPASPPPAPPPRPAVIRVATRPPAALSGAAARLEPRRQTIWMIDGVQHTDSSFRTLRLGPDEIVSIIVPTGNEWGAVYTGPWIVTIRTRRASPVPADSTRHDR